MNLPDELISKAFEILGAFFVGLLGWNLKNMNKKVEEVEQQLNKLELLCSEKYQTKVDFQRFEDRLFDKLDAMDDKLDLKADK